MKNSNVMAGIGFILVGIALLLVAILTNSVLDSLLIGFASGAICSGIAMLCKFFYWNLPKNQERYLEKIEKENIELHDELRIMLRDKSGRYGYVLGLIAVSISIVVFSILGKLEIIADSRTIVLYLGAYLAFQIVLPMVFYYKQLRKY